MLQRISTLLRLYSQSFQKITAGIWLVGARYELIVSEGAKFQDGEIRPNKYEPQELLVRKMTSLNSSLGLIPLVMCMARPQAVSQAKPGLNRPGQAEPK